ncbi:hypothetical protein QM012_002377 [Aureobasidium pullulans]|uniref:Uncharacterized protein n=1 Tax=Aureobasidium pullulans TaxID=5580 RepID=A0ABR0TC67_AURPU
MTAAWLDDHGEDGFAASLKRFGHFALSMDGILHIYNKAGELADAEAAVILDMTPDELFALNKLIRKKLRCEAPIIHLPIKTNEHNPSRMEIYQDIASVDRLDKPYRTLFGIIPLTEEEREADMTPNEYGRFRSSKDICSDKIELRTEAGDRAFTPKKQLFRKELIVDAPTTPVTEKKLIRYLSYKKNCIVVKLEADNQDDRPRTPKRTRGLSKRKNAREYSVSFPELAGGAPTNDDDINPSRLNFQALMRCLEDDEDMPVKEGWCMEWTMDDANNHRCVLKVDNDKRLQAMAAYIKAARDNVPDPRPIT